MDRLTRTLAGLIRCLAGLLGEHRRDWVHALLAETGDQPTSSARLAWLGGGLWLVAREVLMNRLIQVLAFAAGAVALVWVGWPGAASNAATSVNRMWVVGIVVLLAVLPLLVRRYVASVRSGWAPRENTRIDLQMPGHSPFPVNRYIIAKGDSRELVLYWFWAHNRGVASEYWNKFYLVSDSIKMNRSDGSLIRIISPVQPGETIAAAQQRITPFVNQVLPLLNDYIPR